MITGRGRFRWRTKIRRSLPWFLVDRGIASKGTTDCGDHDWYNADGVVEHCYHCTVGLRPYDPAHLTRDLSDKPGGSRGPANT